MKPKEAHTLIKEEIPNMFLSEYSKDFYKNLTNFDIEFFSCFNNEDEVVSFSVNNNVKIIVKHNSEKEHFSLINLYTIGTKWFKSTEINHVSLEELLKTILNRM